jgi:hypothetical protein
LGVRQPGCTEQVDLASWWAVTALVLTRPLFAASIFCANAGKIPATGHIAPAATDMTAVCGTQDLTANQWRLERTYVKMYT